MDQVLKMDNIEIKKKILESTTLNETLIQTLNLDLLIAKALNEQQQS